MRTFSFSSALAITAAMSLSGSSWAQGDMALAFSQMGMGALPAPWHFVTLPGKNPTSFTVTDLDGQNVLKVATQDAYGNMVHTLHQPLQPVLSCNGAGALTTLWKKPISTARPAMTRHSSCAFHSTLTSLS